MLETIQSWFEQYGYAVLFMGLFSEFIALPFPGETAMTYAGYLSYEGSLNAVICIIVAFIATTSSLTATYAVGYRAGLPLFERYGKRVGLGPDKLARAERWFEHYGYGLLFAGYFIPGVRHATGYVSGILRLPFHKFALYSYSGAFVWVCTFIGLGLWVGPQWEKLFHLVAEYAAILVVASAAIATVVYVLRRKKPR